MSLETQIYNALSTITEFVSVKFLVQEAGNNEQPVQLPFVVYETGEKDYSQTQTMCGVDPTFYFQEFSVQIFTSSSVEGQTLATQTITALTGIGTLMGISIGYEPDLRAYTTTVNFS